MSPPLASFFGFMSCTFTFILDFFAFALFLAGIAPSMAHYRTKYLRPALASFFGFMSCTFTLAFFFDPRFFAAMTCPPPIPTGPSAA